MSPISMRIAVAALTGAVLAIASFSPAAAGGYGGGNGPGCNNGGGSSITIIKNINNSKWINIQKSIDLSKNIYINKTITINKGGSANAEAFAFAAASASASANASANVTVYNGSYQYVTVNQKSEGALGAVKASGRCEMQEATVVKAIHAVCVSAGGEEFPASHMAPDTWIDSGYEGEVLRCIPGSHLKVVIGDVVQSDQGMAGTYSKGTVLECGEHEAVRHYKDGMLKCAPAVSVPDCTERTNLRKYGTGDMFFSFRTMVCANSARTAARELELDGLALNGGVGDDSGY